MPKIEKPEKVVAPEPDSEAPADALKAEADEENEVVTYDGAEYTILVRVSEDLDLVEAIAAYAAGNGLRLPEVVETIIGPEAYEAFKARYRDEKTGRTPYKPLRELFGVLDEALGK